MNFKKTLLTAALVVSSAASMAAGTLTVSGGAATSFSVGAGAAFDPTLALALSGYTSELTGSASKYDKGALLSLNQISKVTVTFLGREAAFQNSAFFFGNQEFLNGSTLIGTTQTFWGVGAGTLNFGFKSNNSGSIYSNPNGRIAFMTNGTDTSAMALFNDNASDVDYDDMVLRITVSSVPETETYAMMLAGLGLMGTIVRRRNKAKTA